MLTRSRILAAAALLVALATFARATRCSAGPEVLVGVVLTAALIALWNDDRERGLASRIAKFIILGLLVGTGVAFVAVALHVRCVAVVSPSEPGPAPFV